MKAIAIHAAAFMLLTGAGAARADADADAGKALHDAHCLKCHKADVYTRKDHLVQNLAQLSKRVMNCQLSVGVNWFDDDVANVVEYLNQNYYHFKE
jgi:mono/diheme cytochrome c family protein